MSMKATMFIETKNITKEQKLDQQEKNKKQKQELLKKFQEKNKKLLKETHVIDKDNKNEEKFSKDNKLDNKELKELKTKFKILTEKYNNAKKELQDFKQKDKSLREKVYDTTEINRELKKESDSKDKIIIDLKSENQKLNKEKAELEIYKDSEPMALLKFENEKLKYTNKGLQAKITNLEKKVESLNNQILNFESTGKLDEHFSYKGKYEKVKKEYTNLSERYGKLKKNKTIDELNKKIYELSLINTNLKISNKDLLKYIRLNKIMIFLEYYTSIKWQWNWISLKGKQTKQNKKLIKDVKYIELDEIKEINDSVSKFEKICDDISESWEYEDLENEDLEKIEENQDISYGYISMQDELYCFISIDGGRYTIINQEECTEPDLPCKVEIISPDEVLLLDAYDSTKNIFNRISKTKSKLKKNKMSENIEKLSDYYKVSLEGFNVLIVGSRFKTKYTSILTQVGLNVLWHNPFEEAPHNLTNKMLKSDVIILCAEHISHTMLNWIDKEDDRVQVLYKDTSTKLLARIKFALITNNKI
jgi:hypothetical protein